MHFLHMLMVLSCSRGRRFVSFRALFPLSFPLQLVLFSILANQKKKNTGEPAVA